MSSTVAAPTLRATELLHQLVAWHTNSGDVDWIWATPVFLSAEVQQQVTEAAAQLVGDEKQHADDAIALLRLFRDTLLGDPTKAPLGSGPLERLRERIHNGEINAPEAMRIATELGATGALSDVYVKALGRLAYSLAVQHEWRDAVRFSLMLRSAVHAAARDSDIARLLDDLDAAWIEIASAALWQVPDARLYADALATGEALVQKARDTGNQSMEGAVLHALGTLHLDPWFGNRSSETYLSEHRQWYQRAESDESWDHTAHVLDRPAPLPTPAEALAKAESYYAASAALPTGKLLGRTLKALAQTLLWRTQLDGTDRNAQTLDVIDRAFAALDVSDDPAMVMELYSYQTKAGSRQTPAVVEPLLKESPDALVRRIGHEQTLNLYFYLADLLTAAAPERALVFVQQVAHVFAAFAGETMRPNWWRAQLLALIAATSPRAGTHDDPPASSPDTPEPIKAAYEETLHAAEREQWSESQLAAELIRLARQTTPSNEERFGIELLDRAEHAAPLTLTPFRDAIAFLRASLWINSGSNAVDRNDYPGAVSCYARALDGYLELKAMTHAADVLTKLADVAGDGGADGAAALLEPLIPHAVTLQTMLGDDGMIGVRQVCERAIGALITAPFDLSILTNLWQLAKGLQFGTFLTSGSSHRFTRPEQATEVLAQIEELRTLADDEPIMSSVLQGALQSEAILLAPYSRSAIRLAGQSVSERLTNLELRYEALIDLRLRSLADDESSAVIAPSDMRDGIDPDTVLLDLLEIVEKNGKSTVLYALWTRDDVDIAAHQFDDQRGGYLVADGVTIPQSGLADMVQATRGSLRDNPPAGTVASPNALEDLAYVGDVLLQTIWAQLTALRASGKTKLCVVPHGPLHYLPFHLLTIDGKPLCDYWTVSYLPNIRVLLANRGRQTVRRHRSAGPVAIGVSLEESDQPLLEAVAEAREIARVAGGTTLLNAQATEQAVHHALRDARMVHIATHGALPSGAAAFQRVYLSPGAGDDGILYAHELLGRDYRGLSLVTLSACETALGRFDSGDNLRGLPATLFLAGVDAVVGTLWPVETTAARTFFCAMYGALATGVSRLDAFATAQADTRAEHPEYRDWGAFYFSGTWS
jgi:CHAT domain-containing protein